MPTETNLIEDLQQKIDEVLSNSTEKDFLIDSITDENNLQSSKIKDMENNINNLKLERECKICMVKNADMLVLPCAHLAMCQPCEVRCRNQTKQRCPICRKFYNELIKIYT